MPLGNKREIRNTLHAAILRVGPRYDLPLGAFLFALIFCIDYMTAYRINTLALYLIPIIFITVSRGLCYGLPMSVLCAISQTATDVLTGFPDGDSAGLMVFNTFITALNFIAFVMLLSELLNAYKKEFVTSRVDELTKISNRRDFYERAEIELCRCKRFDKPFNILLIDSDNFKVLNDTLGHFVGDKALQTIATTISDNIRKIDLVARFGGDEFAVMLPEISMQDAQCVAHKLREKLNAAMRANNWSITCSIGFVSSRDYTLSLEQLLHKADMAMYASKRQGKDCVTGETTCQGATD